MIHFVGNPEPRPQLCDMGKRVYDFWVICIQGRRNGVFCNPNGVVMHSSLHSNTGLLHDHILEDVSKRDRYKYAFIVIITERVRTSNVA